ncbi:TonB-dependent siderophore receptor [Methylophaga frappieri]|uniref:TonB-dependent siderophore receptor n=2 Tax=Methylophaga frappieri (strain ATCC BAA-2434 / DSM 25690 / JAM7) TaxID=754477 RepID=I1YG98_METFJ|nr:TonB-dependent siderophore receptor [Methylophaga frappieri]
MPVAVSAADTEEKENYDLPAIQVQAEHMALNTEGTNSYATGAVTLGKGAENLRAIPQSVSVITSQLIKDKNLLTLNDALQNTTGVTVKTFGTGTANYIMRGFELNTINIDGIETSASGSGTHGHGAPDLAAYERVEVLRGPAGLLQGSGEPGGFINLVRKRALAENRVAFRGSANSWPGYRTNLDVTGALNDAGTLRGRAVAAYEDSDSHIDDVDMEKKVFYGTLELDLSSDTTVSVGASLEDTDDTPYVGVPLYADGSFAPISRDLYTGTGFNYKESRLRRQFVELEHHFDSGAEAVVTLNHSDRDMRYLLNYTTSPIDPVTGDVDRWSLSADQELEESSFDAHINLPVTFLGMEHKVLLGANGSHSENNNKGYMVDTAYPSINVFDPDSASNPRPNLVPAFSFGKTDTRERGLYFKTTSNLTEATKLILGGRFTDWKTDAMGSVSEFDNEFTPYGGLVYDLNDTTTVYVSAAESFVPQTNLDANEKLLDPRTGTQYEVGMKGVLNNGAANYQLAVFQLTDENRAISDPNNPLFSIAGGKVRARGFETEISGTLFDKLDVLAGYAYIDTEQLKAADPDAEGNVFNPDAPEHSLKLWGKYNFNQQWAAGLGVEYNSGTFYESGNVKWEQGGYTTLSAMVAYQISPDSRFILNGTNLTDKRYYSRVSGPPQQSYFGDPLKVTLTFETEF